MIVSPRRAPAWWEAGDTAPFFAIATSGVAGAVAIVAVAGSDAPEVPPITPVPVAVAVSVTKPASTSPVVTVWALSAVQMTEPSGASGGDGVGQVTGPIVGSSTITAVRLTLPVLVTR